MLISTFADLVYLCIGCKDEDTEESTFLLNSWINPEELDKIDVIEKECLSLTSLGTANLEYTETIDGPETMYELLSRI